MNTPRPRARFVPTLTEVVRPAGEAVAPSDANQALGPGLVVRANPSRSALDAAVDDLMPHARERLRQSLHAAAYALADEQLRSMEGELRQRLRVALGELADRDAHRDGTPKD